MNFKALLIVSFFLQVFSVVKGVYLNLNNDTSINNAAALLVQGTLDYYEGYQYGGTIGMFQEPYYWWEAGGVWGAMIDYWYITGNDTFLNLTKEALLYQTGDDWDYIPLNQSTVEGNDDQAFWGIAAMSAAERNFSNPSSSEPQWLYLAQAVFNTMASRWDDKYCGGGLRWQIFSWNNGYDYKNSVSNAALFHLAGRLARYTGNTTYVDWANKIFDWMIDIKLITLDDPWSFVYDGGEISDNCTDIVQYQWTYNQGLVLAGCAYLAEYTNETTWYNRTMSYMSSSSVFFNNSVLYEAACQTKYNCNTDQRSFRAYFARFLGLTAQLVPDTQDQIMTWLNASAIGAAESCSGGTDGHTCGINWSYGGWDGWYGLGEQIDALEVILNTQILSKDKPYTNNTGGTSTGSADAGSKSTATNVASLNITGKDKAGAGVLTAVLGLSLVLSGIWLIM
ncbi:hydrolase 76 protein [Hanseniaspora valbyensis]